MNPKRKTEQIDRLATAIGYIATDFERFGGLFLDALLEVPMNHQGTNLLGYAVGGVVDTVSADGRIVAEYSDTARYFRGKMEKARSDLKKALRRKPLAKDVFLLAGDRKRPQVAQDFEKSISKWKRLVGKTLHIWGAEEIATHLVDELIFSDTVVRRIAAYLPLLQQIRDEEAASRLAPTPDRSQLIRTDVDSELSRRLASNACVTITGMGGLGKSAAAAAFAADHENDYDLVIWLERGEVSRPEHLQALSLVRGGEARNVATLLRTRACLLIVDDADAALEPGALTHLCGPRSHVILTQRIVTQGSYQLPLLSRSEAEAILNQASPTPCPREVADVIWSTVGGHPLSLSLMRAAVTQGAAWTEIAADCQAVGEFEDRGQKLADRLLGRLRGALERELSVFAWARQPLCGQDFLEQIIQPLGIRKLRTNGLTAADRSGVVRLHDVVFSALSSGDWCSADRSAELDAALESYLVAASKEPGLRFWTIARILRSKIEQLVAGGDRRPAFRYALLSAWDPAELRPGLVGDPMTDAESLTGAPPPLAVIAVIEAVEQLFFYDKLRRDDEAETGLRARLVVFDRLATIPGLTSREVAEISHHKGKALKRLGRAEEAAQLFEEVLRGSEPLNESRLQLIDVYRTDPAKADRVVQLADDILGRVAGTQGVTYSVFLGVVERLPWGSGAWRTTVIERHQDAIQRTIVEAANVGVQYAFQAFAGIGRYLSQEWPQLFERIFGQLPEPTLASIQIDTDRFAWAEIFFEASRLPGADAAHLRARALEFYEAEVRPQPFHLQRRAELLIDMERTAEAEMLLQGRDDLDRSEWLQRLMARARLGQGDPEGALVWINKALERLKAAHFRSEFLELRYDIRAALGDPLAGDDLLEARQASQKDAEATRLEIRLREAGLG